VLQTPLFHRPPFGFRSFEQDGLSASALPPLLADLPTILFTSTAHFEAPFVFEGTEVGRAAWLAMHQDMFGKIRDGSHIRIPDAGHIIHTEMPGRVAAEMIFLVERLEDAR